MNFKMDFKAVKKVQDKLMELGFFFFTLSLLIKRPFKAHSWRFFELIDAPKVSGLDNLLSEIHIKKFPIVFFFGFRAHLWPIRSNPIQSNHTLSFPRTYIPYLSPIYLDPTKRAISFGPLTFCSVVKVKTLRNRIS